MDTVRLGTLVLPVVPLLIAGAMSVSLALGWWVGKPRGTDVEPALWKILVAALIGARAAFVIRYIDLYREFPWSIADIRDGGFFMAAGVLALVLSTAYFIYRKQAGRRALLTAVTAGVAVFGAGIAALTLTYTDEQRLPQVELARLRGGSVVLTSLIGKPLVINLWATWCPPCRREMPVLADAQKRYQDVVFIFANQGETADTVRRYLDTAAFSVDNVLLDTSLGMGRETGSLALPTTLFFDETGVLVERRVGELSAASLADRLRSLHLGAPRQALRLTQQMEDH